MTHTHEYAFWHTHLHFHKQIHRDAEDRIVGAGRYSAEHDTGHYHLWAQTHDHGESTKMPHTHKDKQVHPDESFVYHHAPIDHANELEHHPECKLQYYGGGLKGCIDRCEVGKKKDGK